MGVCAAHDLGCEVAGGMPGQEEAPLRELSQQTHVPHLSPSLQKLQNQGSPLHRSSGRKWGQGTAIDPAMMRRLLPTGHRLRGIHIIIRRQATRPGQAPGSTRSSFKYMDVLTCRNDRHQESHYSTL
ncbi:unnamed protein product [Urochloa humidicola]